MGIFFALLTLILAGVMIAWGFLIGKRNVIIRMIGVGISLVAAIGTVIILKNQGYSTVAPLLGSLLAGTELGDSILDFLSSAETLGDAVVSITGAFAAPIVFAVTFVVFAIVTWIIGWIVSLLIMLVGSDGEKKKRSPAVIIPCAVAQALLTVFVLITPIAAYGGIASAVAERTQEVTQNGDDSLEILDTVNNFDSGLVVGIYRAAGGNAVCKALTSFKIGEERSDLISEADAIGRVVGNVIYLAGESLTEYGEDQSEALKDLSNSLSDSVLIPTLMGEVIYSATDAWLSDSGSFFGVDRPDTEEIGGGIFSEAFLHLLEIFHNDARDREALCADLETVANTVVILAEDGVFNAMGEDINVLIEKLCGGTVRKLVSEFGSNRSFKILIADVTNIGVRAIGSALSIPGDADEVYSKFTGSVADEITSLNASGLGDDEKCDELARVIMEAFIESGVDADLDEEAVKLYARMILEDFGSYDNVTKEDVSEFFLAYSEVSNSIATTNEKMASGVALLSDSSAYEYSSAAYAGKSIDELKTESGAGLLATIMNEVLAAQRTPNSDADDVKRIIEEAYTDYALATGKDASTGKELADSISFTPDSVTVALIEATANMCSSETMAESSTVVTLTDLLVDPEKLAESLDSDEAVQKEAEAIESVFASVGEVVTLFGDNGDTMSTEKLSDVAGNIGAVLDSLSETSALGTENTAKLMTAVMQSETVRNAADLDMKTATEIANAATESEDGKVNYKETMEGIASGANIAEKLANEDEELTREDIRELLDSMTPQTAKVLNTYMTEKRVAGFGVPESKVPISTEMINNLLTEMGDKDKYSSDYESEIDGITTLFDLLNAATSNDKAGKTVFNHGNETGRIDSDAYDFVGTVLGSDMVCNALLKSLKTSDGFEQDPFGLNLSQTGADYIAVSEALDRHLTEKGDSYSERIDAVAALFGVER